MGLRSLLASAAVCRATVLVVEVPGWGLTRCAVEQEVRRRGWRMARSPADADVLAVCGRPGDRLAAAVDLVWAQLPGPRARVDVTDPAEVAPALDDAAAGLADEDRQRADALARPPEPEPGRPAHDADDPDDPHMPMPGGIPLAGGGDDRDGLALDVLHVPLGPILPYWPAGLMLHCTLSGDVVQEVRPEVLGAAEPAPPAGDLVHGSPADRCDRASTLLALAGWADAATGAARIRDDLLDRRDPAGRRSALDRLARQVGRSRSLRWALRDLPAVGERPAGLLGQALDGLDGHARPVTPTTLPALADRLAGRDVAAVRLLVAAADLDVAAVARSGAEIG